MIERRAHHDYIYIIKKRIKLLLHNMDMLSLRLILALSAISSSFIILLNDIGPLTSLMYSIMPSTVWALLFAIQGSIMLVILLCQRKPKVAVILDGILGSILWTASTIACLFYQLPEYVTLHQAINYFSVPFSLVPNIGLTIGSWWVLIRYYSHGDL